MTLCCFHTGPYEGPNWTLSLAGHSYRSLVSTTKCEDGGSCAQSIPDVRWPADFQRQENSVPRAALLQLGAAKAESQSLEMPDPGHPRPPNVSFSSGQARQAARTRSTSVPAISRLFPVSELGSRLDQILDGQITGAMPPW